MEDFDLSKMDEIRRALNSPAGGDLATIRLEWQDGTPKGNVIAVPDPQGKYTFNKNHLPR